MRDDTSNRDELIDVFDRHYEALYAYVAYRVTPDRQAAEDLTQEVVAAALNGASRKHKRGAQMKI